MAYLLFFILHHVLTRHSIIQNILLDQLENDKELNHQEHHDASEEPSNRKGFCSNRELRGLASHKNLGLFFRHLG
jgi:hypothetical protein